MTDYELVLIRKETVDAIRERHNCPASIDAYLRNKLNLGLDADHPSQSELDSEKATAESAAPSDVRY
ncbi:hypothetical protein [Halomarina pelagica]|uniref:hypothetical protein n=1 Tax=Halomarina pelagica TaxID=2961599 RepID=UPI0020C2439D|nr:hypothetical protein [Halomarina sp. BND7]